MDSRKFQVLSWIIVMTITMTVLAQGYWNWRNYEENKRFLISEMQVALDNSVEQYYAELAKVHFIQMGNSTFSSRKILRTTKEIDTLNWTVNGDIEISKSEEIHTLKLNIDSMVTTPKTNMVIVSSFNTTDSILPAGDEKRFIKLASKLASSLEADTLDQKKLDSLVLIELERKGIYQSFEIVNGQTNNQNSKNIFIRANPAYLAPGTEIFLATTPSFGAILKKGISGVIISTLTALIIIGVLIYLYRFIQHQKSLDLMKNDLISNITHEFKTPIATVSTALEAIEKFNTEKDIDKTNKYLKLSNEQLEKLNGMVEKLLDTATLEEGELQLNLENTDLVQLVQETVNKYESTTDKTILWGCNTEVWANVDRFHFEHVLSNLMDNAIKYGGNHIEVTLERKENQIILKVSDNGNGIDKKEQHRIFDKFYRIPSGNVHNVKGYGIGLYYARTILEKHGGRLQLDSNPNETTFKITLNT